MIRFLGIGSGWRDWARRAAVGAAGTALVMTSWNCAGPDVVPYTAPIRVRLFNAGAGAPSSYLNMNGVATGDTVAYGQYGRYTGLTDQNQSIQVRSAGGVLLGKIGGPPVVLGLQDVTVYLLGGANSSAYIVTEGTDNHQNAISGVAWVKQVNAGQNVSSEVTVFRDGAKWGSIPNASEDAEFGYEQMVAGSHSFKFTSGTDTNVVYASKDFTFKSGYRYTVALIGVRLSSPSLQLVALADSADGAAPERLGMPWLVHNPLR